MNSPDIRQFFSKPSSRDPLYELQPESTTKETLVKEPEQQNLSKKMDDTVTQKPCPKRRKKSLENIPCPKSKKAKISPLVSPEKNMELTTVFTARDLLTSSSDSSASVSRESSPEEVLGSKEFSDESDVEVETTDKNSTKDEQPKTIDTDVKQDSNTVNPSTQDKNDSTASSADDSVEEFEVEKVKDYKWCRATTQGMYLVSWIGWESPTHDTWEPLANLTSCDKLLREFYPIRVAEREAAPSALKRNFEVPPDPRTTFERRNEFADTICPPPCQSELEAFYQRLNTHPVKEWKEQVLNQCFDKVQKSKAPNEKLKLQLREQIMLKHILCKKKEQQDRLKEWAAEINAIDTGHAKITVENSINLEGPPRQMKYINKSKPSNGIVIPDDPPFGCECPGESCDLKTEKTCCPKLADVNHFPYTKYGRLRISPGVPIYECNKRCKCGKDCTNRVVQKGRKVKLCIYQTDNNCGWGVKTLENIKKGSFVVEYVGEVITNEEAEERGKKYDAEGRTYLFDLDFDKGQDNPYTVDAAHFGNVAHFINHSCDPSLAVFNVWINCLDPDLPRLALFAVRDIVKGEQLTFDYSQRTGDEDTESETEENGENAMECMCGSSICRKILFS